MGMRNTPRSFDDMHLDWVARRSRGQSSHQIARRYGVTPSQVRIATNRIRSADLAESGEDQRAVDARYWR